MEDAVLPPAGVRSSESSRRHTEVREPEESDVRTAFQRDRDRILHSRAFRRLKHKTQVYMPHTADHQRTRLTHTLEVAQIGRTMARSLGLNEDLVEAIALGHDLGHTPFGHTGEQSLRTILAGNETECPLPEEVVQSVGTFKHNYQSLRVVDWLEDRSQHPGLNLSDQVREGILKHTSWKARSEFPLPETTGLRLDRPCHLEGQVVALADEIAQQTHDLEDGLTTQVVSLDEIERLDAAVEVAAMAGPVYGAETSRRRRSKLLLRGLIRLLVTDAIETTAQRVQKICERRNIARRGDWLAISDSVSATTVRHSPRTAAMLAQLKAFIYRFIINDLENNRRDHRAHLIVTGLFRAYHRNPLTLPDDVLRRFQRETGLPFLRAISIHHIPDQVARTYHPEPRFARLIADHLAGMSDRYALAEYEALYHPGSVLRSSRAGRW